jgi:sulfatase maturation enzyme AslB (radical SAM superfamily)
MSNPFKGIRRLHLMMGLQCNARCVMCYQTDFSPKYNMPAEIYREHLLPVYPHIQSVKMQGGEPTIMPNCRDLAGFLRGYDNIRFSITTNGIHLDDFWLEAMVAQGGFVNFSLNAASKQSYQPIVKYGDFDKVQANLKRMLASRQGHQPVVAISMVVLNHNILEVADFIELGAELGVDQVSFGVDPILSFANLPPKAEIQAVLTRADELARSLEMETEALDVLLRDFGVSETDPLPRVTPEVCPLPFNNLVVDERGDVRVCCNTWKILGNTYRDAMEDIVAGKVAKRFRRKVEAGDYNWCDPYCGNNPKPSKQALLNKYSYLARRDPKGTYGKLKAKLKRRKQLAS